MSQIKTNVRERSSVGIHTANRVALVAALAFSAARCGGPDQNCGEMHVRTSATSSSTVVPKHYFRLGGDSTAFSSDSLTDALFSSGVPLNVQLRSVTDGSIELYLFSTSVGTNWSMMGSGG